MLALACSAAGRGAEPSGGEAAPAEDGAAGAGGGTGAGGAGTDAADAAVLLPDVAAADAPGCLPCSADLKSVLDCAGNVVQECGPDAACAGGACIPDPCGAAAQARSSFGCEFFAVNPPSVNGGNCFAAYVVNTWSKPAKLAVERGGQSLPVGGFARIPQGQGPLLTYGAYDDAQGLPPGEVAILFLAQGTPLPIFPVYCPPGITPAIAADGAIYDTAYGEAFRIASDVPVVAYQIYPYGGAASFAPSATLLLPTSAWGDNYVAVNGQPQTGGASPPPVLDATASSLGIVALADDTLVTVRPTIAIPPGNGVPGAPAGVPTSYALARGQYLQFATFGQLTGSAILASKPVGVFGGAAMMNVPPDQGAADSAHQQLPPVRALGHEYAAVAFRGRKGVDEDLPWRMVGAADGTLLSYEPAAPPGAPATLALGEAAELWTSEPFVVRSQDENHPFYLAGHMTGWVHVDPSASVGPGDPEWVNSVPVAQYLDRYVFFTDPTYPVTNLVVVRRRGADGAFHDVTLDCAGPIAAWQPVGAYEYARVDVVLPDFQPVGACANGRHEMTSAAPFGLTVWGWGPAASYAYPGGSSVREINTTFVPAEPR